MFNLGMTEVILILVVALVIFGPGKLPEVGRTLGKTIKEFKSAVNKIDEDIKKEVNEIKDAADLSGMVDLKEDLDLKGALDMKPKSQSTAKVIDLTKAEETEVGGVKLEK